MGTMVSGLVQRPCGDTGSGAVSSGLKVVFWHSLPLFLRMMRRLGSDGPTARGYACRALRRSASAPWAGEGKPGREETPDLLLRVSMTLKCRGNTKKRPERLESARAQRGLAGGWV